MTVEGFVPGAKIAIYANGSVLLGGDVSDSPWGQSFSVTPDLVAGQDITATQTVGSDTSAPSKAVEVRDYFKEHPAGLTKPEITEPLHDCGGAISVDNLVPGGLLEVFADGTLVGDAAGCGAGQWTFVTPVFAKGQQVHARETLCTEVSPNSDKVQVLADPSPLPAPTVGDVYDGSTHVAVHNIVNGAMVTVQNGPTQIAGHYCAGGGQIFKLSPAPAAGDELTAMQKLCADPSPRGTTTVKPCTDLPAPRVMPICVGDHFATVGGTALDSRIRVYANGNLVGDGGGTRINLTATMAGGEMITATQSLGTCVSPSSSAVKVGEGAVRTRHRLTMKNGHEFFVAETGEQAIEGLVYPRGKNCAPAFIANKLDGAESVNVQIIAPSGDAAATVPLVASGALWVGAWDWTSTLWTAVPQGIPVGRYLAKLIVDGTAAEEMRFYVIFNPSEVNAREEYALSDKGEVAPWFYPPKGGQSRAKPYYLHPDDARIFDEAMQLVNKQTSAYQASSLLMDWVVPQGSDYCDEGGGYPSTVTKRFVYSICTSESDTLDLLARSDKLAQCADSAAMFAALLRAVGIPAHPTTGDAAREQGAINWGFDTWTEARLDGPAGEQWYVFHPHDPPNGYGPVSQLSFGMNHQWAKKSVNDVTIFAKESWDPMEVADGDSDVKMTYGTPCKEPDQSFTLIRSWIQHICTSSSYGQGYWGKGHWTCSPPKNSIVRAEVARTEHRPGDTVELTVVVENTAGERMDETLEIAVVEDVPQTKRWPDRTLKSWTERVRLRPGKTQSFARKVHLPQDAAGDHVFAVVASMPEVKDAYAITEFSVAPAFEWTLDAPKSASIGGEFDVKLTLQNSGQTAIRKVTAAADVPLHIEANPGFEGEAMIEPGTRKTLSWTMRVLSRSAVTQLRLRVKSENGGSIEIVHAMQIAPAERK
ncbi:MAG: hypothetical protein GY937_13535 [bacterium]|nr:hypothetical protein [bacterium]